MDYGTFTGEKPAGIDARYGTGISFRLLIKAIQERCLSLVRWQYLGVTVLLLVIVSLQLSIIDSPSQVIFDEEYYVGDARSIIAGEGSHRPEHPPLGKLIITGGVLAFGDNPRGWRLPSIFFGLAALLLFYLICRELKLSRGAAFFATFFLAFDNMTFVQASVAMLDVFYLAFILAAFLFYLKRWYFPAVIAIVLSMLVKVSGVLALGVIFLHWPLTSRKNIVRMLTSAAYVPIFFTGLLIVFEFAVSRQFVNPITQARAIMSLSGSLTFASSSHPSATRPWEWVLSPELMPYWYDPHYVSVVSFTIWVLIVPLVIFMAFRIMKGNYAAAFGLAWFAGTYLSWIPLELLTNRLTYVFYFYPTVGAVCLGLGIAFSHVMEWRKKHSQGWLREAIVPVISAYSVLHIAIFLVLSPVFSPWLLLRLWD